MHSYSHRLGLLCSLEITLHRTVPLHHLVSGSGTQPHIHSYTIWFCYAQLRQPCIDQCHCIITWFWFTNVHTHTDTICSSTLPLHDLAYSTLSPGSWFRYSTIMYTCSIRFWCGSNIILLWTDIKYWLPDWGSSTLPLHDIAYIHSFLVQVLHHNVYMFDQVPMWV